MDTLWPYLLLLLLAAALAKLLAAFAAEVKTRSRLPPGPTPLPLIGNLHQLGLEEIEPKLQKLHDKYGPIVTVYQGPDRHVFVAGHAAAHETLVKNGAAYGHRIPAPPENFRLFGGEASEPFIGFTDCGPLWRLLRRNLQAELLSPSRLTAFAGAREAAARKLLDQLGKESGDGDGVVRPVESFRFALFSAAMAMVFGEELDDEAVAEAMAAVRASHQNLYRFFVFHIFPNVGKYVFPGMWKEMLAVRRRLVNNLLPLVQARAKRLLTNVKINNGDAIVSYADSLLAVELPGDGRKLEESEITTLCYEFLTAGVSTVVSTLQWTMANLVKQPLVQAKLFDEIVAVVGGKDRLAGRLIGDEELRRMPYLKSIVMETLRRHPPIHTLLPHRVTEEVTIEGYTIPKDTYVNFMLVSMGRDGVVWEDPMEFRPERFAAGPEAVDLTGTRGVTMIPFGAGRRVCPGMGLGTLHLELMVANLVKEFEWKEVVGEEVELGETMKNDIDYVMKKPLKARIVRRRL